MKWFMNRKIAVKLLIGFMIVAVLAGGVGVYGIISLVSLNTTSNTLAVGHGDAAESMGNMMSRYYEQQYLASKILAESSTNPELIPDDLAAIKASDASMMDSLEFITNSSTAETMDIVNKVTAQIEAYRSYIADLTAAYAAGDMAGAANIMAQNDALGDANAKAATKAVLDEFKEFDDNFANAMINSVKQSTDNNIMIMIIIVAAAVLIAVFLGILISKMISKPIKYLAAEVEKVAAGDFNIKESNYDVKDETGILVRSFRNVLRALKAMSADVNMLTEAATEGELSVRADASKHMGDFAKLIEGINNTLDAVIEPINEASEVMSELSKGNLNVKVSGDYKGDHAVIKNALNETIDSLEMYIGEVSQALGNMSEGDLTISIGSEFKGDFIELKESINSIAGSLSQVMSEINIAAEQVAAGTSQVSEGSQAISQGATEQASAIEQLTATVTEIAEQTRQNAMSAGKANELAVNAKQGAAQGNEQMKAMQSAMEEINESSANISKIIKVIDDIAFQTNILALNAAVEAARAGVHGKGFAVVAEEVRNLAARSANAAKETTALIEGSIKKTEAGTDIANKTANALAAIVEGVDKAAELTGQIAVASDEQATGITQVNNGIEQLSTVVQTNSATSEETAASSEELSSQAEMLKTMVGRFKLKDKAQAETAVKSKSESKAVESAAEPAKPRIALNDSEFGKY